MKKPHSIHIQSFKWFLENEKNQFNNLWYIPLSSFENEVTSMIFFNKRFYPIDTQHDVCNLTKRYHSMRKILLSCKATMKEGIRRGIVVPKIVCTAMLKDMKEFYKTKSYVIKVHQDLITSTYKNAIVEFGITLNHLIEFIETIYLPKCRTTIGICHLPSGKRNYEKIVVGETTLDITPKEIFTYGLAEVSRIRKEFTKVQLELGFDGLSYMEFCKRVMNDPNNYSKSEKELLDYYHTQRTRVRNTVVKKYFKNGVKNTYLIEPIPKEIEESSVAAFYYAGNYKKKNRGVKAKGTFFVNTRNLKTSPLYSAFVLSLHEGEPGHHYQFQHMIESDVQEYSVFTFNSDGFVEGWALYVESLGNYTPIEMFGKLSFEMLRAVRLVVDVGIHYYGWSWKKALDYMTNNIPMAKSELESELMRYICIPGQAVAYKIGEKFFKELRDEYLSTGKKTIQDFHHEVLKYGIVPLEVLKKHFSTL